MTTTRTPSPKCRCCGGKIHGASDLVAYRVYTAEPGTQLVKGLCDKCGSEDNFIAARIVFTRYNGELLRDSLHCMACYEAFKKRYQYNK